MDRGKGKKGKRKQSNQEVSEDNLVKDLQNKNAILKKENAELRNQIAADLLPDKAYMDNIKDDIIDELRANQEQVSQPGLWGRILFKISIWALLLSSVAAILVFYVEESSTNNRTPINYYTIDKISADFITDKKLPIKVDVMSALTEPTAPNWIPNLIFEMMPFIKNAVALMGTVATLTALIFVLDELGKKTEVRWIPKQLTYRYYKSLIENRKKKKQL